MLALVIDDARTVRIIIGGILQELGVEVLYAANGQEGLDQLQREPEIELILVDWNMPVMNGLEFIQAVRADRAHDRIRILMVTTEAEAGQMARALDAGANEYLMKPFNRDVLVAKLSLLDVFDE